MYGGGELLSDKKPFGITSTVDHGQGFGIVRPGAETPTHPAYARGFPQIGKAFVQLPAVCLLLDILGFGRLMVKGVPVDIAGESAIFFQTCLDSFSVDDFSDEERSDLKGNLMRLSDTAALWCYTCKSYSDGRSEAVLEVRAISWILRAGQHLLCHGFKNKRYAFRGAVAFGDCVQDAKGGAIIGIPWACAANFEKAQQWAGIAIHPSAASLLTDQHKSSGLVVETQVPLKNGKTEKGWVVDWRNSKIQRSDVEATFSRIGEAGDTEQEKQKHTLQFFDGKE